MPKPILQRDRLEAFTRFGVMVALADGRAAQAELRVVRQFLAEIFGQDPELIRRFDPLIELCTVSKPHEATTLGDAKRLASGPEELQKLYRWATAVADASSGRNDREAALLSRIVDAWEINDGLAPRHAEAVGPSTRTPAPLLSSQVQVAEAQPIDPKAELEIPHDAVITVELVRRRYRLATDRLDANRLGELGAEFGKLAVLKRERLEAAAMSLLKPFGAPLAAPQEAPAAVDMRHNPDLDAVFGA